MTTVVEGRLTFTFPAAWRAAKYDAWTYYVRQFQKACGGAKAVDILAVSPNNCAWLIECKDYRMEPRTKPMDLALEIAEKVRDTIAGLATARIRATEAAERAMAACAMQCLDIKVVLHLEQPPQTTRLHPVIDVSLLTQKLKTLLRPMDFHPRVTDMAAGNRFGWNVTEVVGP